MRAIKPLLLSLSLLLCGECLGQSKLLASYTTPDPHSTADWAAIAPHLPNPLTASPETLETAGDVLRARRFPEDALTYYKAAANRNGNVERLLKKQGVVHLELQHGLIARLCFQQATRLNRNDSEAWNNLGAADFMLGNIGGAVKEYKRAVRLNRDSAIYHSNLSLAYFEAQNTRKARLELAKAYAIDPDILHHSNMGGYNLQVLAASHYAEVCFEMARIYASQGDADTAISWLTKAADRGYDVRSSIKNDPVFAGYLKDDRIRVMLANVQHLHAEKSKGTVPSLGVDSEAAQR